MATNAKVEQFLEKVNIALEQIPIGERAEIITELKSHIMEVQEHEPNKSINEILNSIGKPEIVAAKYLQDRGLKPIKPREQISATKWIVIGFLGTFGLTIFFILSLLWKFSPIIKVDNETGHVEMLGGTIDVKTDKNKRASKIVKPYNNQQINSEINQSKPKSEIDHNTSVVHDPLNGNNVQEKSKKKE